MRAEKTVDGFLDNGFKVVQPACGEHRSGLDAILLAATVPQSAKGKLADLGAGCGAAGVAVAHRCSNIHVDLLEREKLMLDILAETLKLEENQHLNDRLTILKTDLEAPDSQRGQGVYDHLIANPPYNGADLNPSSNAARAAAHVETPNLLLNWVKAAASMARHKARFSMILRPNNLSRALIALEGRFGSVKILPVAPKENTPANRLIISSVRGGKAPLSLLPPFVVHRHDGAFSEQAESIFRGHSGLELK